MVRNYHEFARLGYPLMAAFSRKSFIGYAYDIDNPAERDAASAAEALLACGLGAQLNQAITQLCSLPDSQIIDISSFYSSEPAYYEDQDEFVNAIVLMRCGVAPRELLDYLHAIENSLGRVRTIANGPRTCDIDIVDYQMYVVDNEVLTLPHPRILERDFVVKPLMELRPNFMFADDRVLTDEFVAYGKAERIR